MDVFGQSLQTVNAKDHLLVLSHTQEMEDWLVVDSFFIFAFLLLCFVYSTVLENAGFMVRISAQAFSVLK